MKNLLLFLLLSPAAHAGQFAEFCSQMINVDMNRDYHSSPDGSRQECSVPVGTSMQFLNGNSPFKAACNADQQGGAFAFNILWSEVRDGRVIVRCMVLHR